MKNIVLLILSSLFYFSLFSQYYKIPDWAENLPQSSNYFIYSIGISDPRIKDTELAESIAIQRALCFAVIASKSDVLLISDYFEKKSEEYRWIIMKDNVEELSKIIASGYVDKNNYTVIDKFTNENNEVFVLLKYVHDNSKTPNFFVEAEYYRKEFEVSNTRALESVKNIILKSKWKSSEMKDTLRSSYELVIWNNDITVKNNFNNKTVTSPGFSYEYFSTIPENFEPSLYTGNGSVKKGIWIGYLETMMQSFVIASKNYQSKFASVSDDYKVSRNDGIYETSTESLSRSVSRNNLSFEYAGFGINENRIYTRTYLYGQRPAYKTYEAIQAEQDSLNNSKTNKCFLKRIFKKKR